MNDPTAGADRLKQNLSVLLRVRELLQKAKPETGQSLEEPGSTEAARYPGGTVIGRYRLGASWPGGMGWVYRAYDTGLGREVALKFLPRESVHDPQRLERFRLEATTLSQLNHPHICTIHDRDEHEGCPFLIMEWIDGKTLRDFIGAVLSLAEVTRLIRQVAQALGAAHHKGIVHRDIKPENIMVRPDGHVKVLDFGLARIRVPDAAVASLAAVGTKTNPGTLIGTTRYMSPEQARAELADSASDIFALGVVLYELATGRHPFAADAPLEAMEAIRTQAPLRPSLVKPGIPLHLEMLILQMLEKDPLRRPAAATIEEELNDMAQELDEIEPELDLDQGRGLEARKRPVGVGRHKEREELWAALQSAVAGRGRMPCVTGEPGIGKTTLVEGFLSELAAAGPKCRVARGRCSERLAGSGAYLPVLEALDSLLHGEAGAALARQMKALAPTWYAEVAPASEERARTALEARAASQERLKRELLAFFQEMARLRPLVIFFDDVHWADPSTVDLLAYLGSRCGEQRWLLIMTLRPAELLSTKHPFLPVKLELQGRGLLHEVALGFLARADVDSYLALAYPGHRFPTEFAARIHAQTEGNPLFLVDLLNYLTERGVIAQDQAGWMLATAVPDPRELPETVRIMIQRKIEQLGEVERRILVAGSVQGNVFDSAVAAQAVALEASDVEERLELLERTHFVKLVGEQEFPSGVLTRRYGFVHVLYQNALYQSLGPAGRARLSAAVAQALLGFHGAQSQTLAAQLALLFEAARDFQRAADFFLPAAQNAGRVFAHQEAIALARRGLEQLARLSDGPERSGRELRLQLTLGILLQVTEGYAAADVEQVYRRARALSEQQHEAPLLFASLWGLWLLNLVRAELPTARELAERLLGLAETLHDPVRRVQAQYAIGVTLFYIGDAPASRNYLEQVVAQATNRRHLIQDAVRWQDPLVTALAHLGVLFQVLGYPDQALQKAVEALNRAREQPHPYVLATGLSLTASIHVFRGEIQTARERVEATIGLTQEQGFTFWSAAAVILKGWTQACAGATAEGIAVMRQGLATFRATGGRLGLPYYCALLADALARDGQVEEALAAVAEGLSVVANNGERFFEADLYRVKGELLQVKGASDSGARLELLDQAEACFQEARGIARRISSKFLELRAVLSLARNYQKRDRKEEARRVLLETYAWFTEGFQTADLTQARALLQELA
jgi:predicted ATPase